MTAEASRGISAPGGGGVPLKGLHEVHHDNASHMDDVAIEPLDEESVGPSEEKEEGTSSLAGATFNFLNSIVGAGIIGLPYALNAAGLWLGILLLIAVAGLADYSSRLLVRVGRAEGLLSYQGLMEGALGAWGRAAATACMVLFSVGAMFAYLLVIGDTVPVVLSHWLGPQHPLAHRELSLALVSCFVVLPLCLRRRISKLAWSSAASMACALLIVVVCCVRAPGAGREAGVSTTRYPDAYAFAHRGFFQAFGVMAFAFVSHHVVFIVYNSLERRQRNERGWSLVAHASIAAALALCAALAVVCYVSFLDTTLADVLRNFPSNDAAINAVRLVLALHVAFVYPVEFFVCRESLRAAWDQLRRRAAGASAGGAHVMEDLPLHQHVALTVLMFLASLAFALAVTDLGIVLELTGGLSAVGLGFVLPAASAWALGRRREREKDRGGFRPTAADRALCAALVAVGAFGGVSSVSSAIRARL